MVVSPSPVKSVPVSKEGVGIPRTPPGPTSHEAVRAPNESDTHWIKLKQNLLWSFKNLWVVVVLGNVCLIFVSSLGSKMAPCFFTVLTEVCRTSHTAPSGLTSSCQLTDWSLIFRPCSTATSQAESTASVTGLAESHRGPRLGIPMVCPQGQSWRSDASGFRVEKSLLCAFFFPPASISS